MLWLKPRSTLFPYTTLFRSNLREAEIDMRVPVDPYADGVLITSLESETPGRFSVDVEEAYVNIKKLPFLSGSPLGLKLRSEEHTSELQSHSDLVCRLLLEKK